MTAASVAAQTRPPSRPDAVSYRELPPERDACRWMNVFTDATWAEFIVVEIERLAAQRQLTLVFAGIRELAERVLTALDENAGLGRIDAMFWIGDDSPRETRHVTGLDEIASDPATTIFIACSTTNADVSRFLDAVAAHPAYCNSEFLYKIRPAESWSKLIDSRDRHDRPGALFVSSVFDDGQFDDIYRYTLERVEQKCSVKDAADLYQLIRQTTHVSGAVAEFGSYRGHSGLIIAETLRRLDDPRTVFLCDTFASFPNESHAADRFWSGTHDVDFEQVRRVFADHENVSLVRGDFADTIDTIPAERYSLVHVDCDAYRSVRLVSERIFPKLSVNGIIAFEDYGHDFCLGARRAVDEYFAGRSDCFRFFSAFSGVQIVLKTAG